MKKSKLGKNPLAEEKTKSKKPRAKRKSKKVETEVSNKEFEIIEKIRKPQGKRKPKTEKVIEPQKYYFEKDQIEKLYRYVDKDKKDNKIMSRYRLWKYIESCFPDLDFEKNYKLDCCSLLNPYVVESNPK